jgi:hypothetical protein
LSVRLGRRVADLWEWRNGYALCTSQGLNLIANHLHSSSPDQVDVLASKLRIGIHHDVEVTDATVLPRPVVSQVFSSALPIAYRREPPQHWAPFAQLILDAAYEATLLGGIINARRGKSNIVLLTSLGGGAFGNAPEWIRSAIKRAVQKVQDFDLDVRLVSYGPPSMQAQTLLDDIG